MTDGLQPKRIASYFFIFLIALLFTLQFGPGSRGCDVKSISSGGSAAATVNGKEISQADFNRAYYTQLEAIRAQNASVTEEMAKQLGFPRQILDRMVEAELLSQAAKERGIIASDSEVRDAVTSSPVFQKEGRFDATLYRQILHDYYRKTDAEYEDEIRRQLSSEKLLELVQSGALISEDELKTRFQRDGNTANVSFVRFLPSMYAGKVPAPKPEVLTSFAKAHEKEIADTFKANEASYALPEAVKARQVLLKSQAADAGGAAKARDRLAALKKEIEAGKPFAQAAKEVSEDKATRAKGGDLGWVERKALPSEVAQAAFDLAPGKISEPIESPAGVTLILVEEKRAAKNRPLDEVKLEVARGLYVKARAAELAKADAEEALKWLTADKPGRKLEARFPPEKNNQPAAMRFETETRPEAVASGSFSAANDSVPHLGPAPALVADLFSQPTPGPLRKLYPVGEGWVVAQATERALPKDEEFAQKRANLLDDARMAKGAELKDSFIRDLKRKASVTTNTELINSVGSRG